MRTSQSGVDLIKRWEGLEQTAYKDIVGVWTIGYGHTAAAGDPIPAKGMTVTEDQAEAILRRDLVKYEAAVERGLKRVPSQAQFDAMVSLCFNIGPGAFLKSTCLRRFNAGDDAGAADALTWFNKAGGKVVRGLVNRRADERDMFMSEADHHEEDVRGLPVEGGEAKPMAKSKTQGLGLAGLLTAGLASWGQLKDGAPEVVEMLGPYLPWVMAAVFAGVMLNRWIEAQRGEH